MHSKRIQRKKKGPNHAILKERDKLITSKSKQILPNQNSMIITHLLRTHIYNMNS